jgi:thiol:disulfide interchange protein
MFRILLLITLSALSVWGKEDPVQWTLTPASGFSKVAPGAKAYLELKATVEPGWHLYSPTTPPGGPIITKIHLNATPAVASYNVYRPQPVRKLDPNFGVDTETYTGDALFLIELTSTPSASGDVAVEATPRYHACSDVKCLPPVKKTVAATISFAPGVASSAFSLPSGYLLVAPSAEVASAPTAPVTAPKAAPVRADEPLLPFLLTAFGFGLAALFTPCVFPMIPITVSFFLKSDSKSSGWSQALVFCLGIVVLFTGLGFLVTAIAGPFGVVQLGSSPWINGFIAVVFFRLRAQPSRRF